MKLGNLHKGDFIYLKSNQKKIPFQVKCIEIKGDKVRDLELVSGEHKKLYGNLSVDMDVESANGFESDVCPTCGRM